MLDSFFVCDPPPSIHRPLLGGRACLIRDQEFFFPRPPFIVGRGFFSHPLHVRDRTSITHPQTHTVCVVLGWLSGRPLRFWQMDQEEKSKRLSSLSSNFNSSTTRNTHTWTWSSVTIDAATNDEGRSEAGECLVLPCGSGEVINLLCWGVLRD